MNNFFHRYKIAFVSVILGILLLWLIAILVFRISQSNRFVKQLSEESEGLNSLKGWSNDTIRNHYKEKWWYEQQLVLAKSDSISLGINLYDSIVQVQLKGTVLFQTKIVKQAPEEFFRNANAKLYQLMFKENLSIDSCSANLAKRPIKKVIAPKLGDEASENKTDSIKEKPLFWKIYTENEIEIWVIGVSTETDSSSTYTWNERINTKIEESFKNPLKSNNKITLILWLNNQDAKSIYRAIPNKSKLIFRD